MKNKLSLGPLPKAQLVKITIAVTAELKDMLERYAELHSAATGESNDSARLIPYMLEAFMARDRAFRTSKRAPRGSTPGE